MTQESILSAKATKMGRIDCATPVDVPAVKKHKVFSTGNKFSSYVDGTLYIPIEPNRTGIDFVMPPWVFQVTLSKNHSAKKLERNLDQFPSVPEWNLCFIIPKVIVNEFKPPNFSAYPSLAKMYKLPVDFLSCYNYIYLFCKSY